MSLPELETAKEFARQAFRNLAGSDQLIRYRLCQKVQGAVEVSVADEDLDILRVAAYLQEVGAIQGAGRAKALASLEMCSHFFKDSLGELDPRLVDCILNHVREAIARTPEGRLMQICHKYAVTHFLDYMLLKERMAPHKFESLQLARIESYTAYLNFHPRGEEISNALHRLFYPR